MIDRYIGRETFKITHWIAALSHKFPDQEVCLRNDALGVINEAALKATPCLSESGG
jgi:hypothetical protein